MNKRIEEIYQQVMDEVCPNPLYRFAELVEAAARKDERERLKALKPVVWQHLEGRNIPLYALDEVTK